MDRIGKKPCVFTGKSVGDEAFQIAGIDEGVADPRCERIEVGDARDQRMVRGAAVFGEIMDLQEQPFSCQREPLDQLRKQPVFPERMVVEMPEVRGSSQRCCGGLSELEKQVIRG